MLHFAEAGQPRTLCSEFLAIEPFKDGLQSGEYTGDPHAPVDCPACVFWLVNDESPPPPAEDVLGEYGSDPPEPIDYLRRLEMAIIHALRGNDRATLTPRGRELIPGQSAGDAPAQGATGYHADPARRAGDEMTTKAELLARIDLALLYICLEIWQRDVWAEGMLEMRVEMSWERWALQGGGTA